MVSGRLIGRPRLVGLTDEPLWLRFSCPTTWLGAPFELDTPVKVGRLPSGSMAVSPPRSRNSSSSVGGGRARFSRTAQWMCQYSLPVALCVRSRNTECTYLRLQQSLLVLLPPARPCRQQPRASGLCLCLSSSLASEVSWRPYRRPPIRTILELCYVSCPPRSTASGRLGLLD